MEWLAAIGWYVLIGLAAGYIAGRLMKSRGNPFYYMALGVAGALLGGILYKILLRVFEFGLELLVAVIGAVILIAAVRAWQRGRFRW
ncbi:MAG: GlsB/YeaQ/YmgE family stress response membrane protein [Pirellulales bacterium]